EKGYTASNAKWAEATECEGRDDTILSHRRGREIDPSEEQFVFLSELLRQRYDWCRPLDKLLFDPPRHLRQINALPHSRDLLFQGFADDARSLQSNREASCSTMICGREEGGAWGNMGQHSKTEIAQAIRC